MAFQVISAIRTILSRQEYLGHTVLRKSISTNFKLHKRKTTDEDEQYVFYNTHEPIISQELWDSVQKRKKRANRAAARGTRTNRLSGYLYCADCGRRMTLQTHYSKKDGSIQYSYRCGGDASRVNSCTPHTISADNVEALILLAVKRISKFVLNDEKAFALELHYGYSAFCLGNMIREIIPINLLVMVCFINIGTVWIRKYLESKHS